MDRSLKNDKFKLNLNLSLNSFKLVEDIIRGYQYDK